MPPVEQSYKYHVFISYSSADQEWASKLFRGLEERGIEPFFDRSRLQAGATWEPQLLEALENSQHIVVLWSEKAKQSGWVTRELGYFDRMVNSPNPDQKSSNRRMIFLLLEGEPKAFTSFQMLTDLRDGEAYAGPADQIDPNLWQPVLDRLYDTIISDDTAIPVPLAILTTTQERLEGLDPAHRPLFVEETLDEFLQRIGIGTKDDLMQRYGLQRAQWRPFSSKLNIDSMLRQLRGEINEVLERVEGTEKVQVRWEPVGEDIWSDSYGTFMKGVDKLKKGLLSVVVVDPLSLYDGEFQQRFSRLSTELQNANVLFLTPLPWQCSGTHLHVRKQIERMASPVFANLDEPTFLRDVPRTWSCDVNVGDKADIKRALLMALGQHVIEEPKSPFLRQ